MWHPKYKQNYKEYCGYDIGVALVEEVLPGKNFVEQNLEATHDYFWGSITSEDLHGDEQVQIAGFPGELPKRGVLHEHTNKVCSVEPTEEGGYRVLYDIDTTHGQSGAPIWLVDQNKL